MSSFPFPSKKLALEEIKNDYMYKKMLKNGIDVDAAAERAWETGAQAARDFYEETGGETDFRKIAREKHLKIERVYKDNVIAGMRYFAEYETKKQVMVLYTESIKKWAAKNNLSEGKAENLILAHEYFHHLENTRLGLTSKQVVLPSLNLFGLKIGKTGVRALSEVGAHAFARTYFELAKRITY